MASRKWNSFTSRLRLKRKIWGLDIASQKCALEKQTTEPKLLILVSFFSGEVTSCTDTNYCILLMLEVCRSMFFMGHPVYVYCMFLFLFPQMLMKTYENTRDKWRALGYKKAISALKNYGKQVTTWEVSIQYAIGGRSSLPLRCHGCRFTRNHCACAPMLYISELCEDCNRREWNWLCVNQQTMTTGKG